MASFLMYGLLYIVGKLGFPSFKWDSYRTLVPMHTTSILILVKVAFIQISEHPGVRRCLFEIGIWRG